MTPKKEKPDANGGLIDPRNLPGDECCAPTKDAGESVTKVKPENHHEPTEAAEGKKPIVSP